MSRLLLCYTCGYVYKAHPEDTKNGFVMRKVFLSAVKPERHGIVVNGEFGEVPLQCDLCGVNIDKDLAVAVSMSQGQEMPEWESNFGTVLTDEALALCLSLGKGLI